MNLFERIAKLFPRDIEADDVSRSAAAHEQASTHAAEVSRRNYMANGRLREAARRVKSSSFADFESAVKHRDR